jgi:hypothetical protein
MSESLAVDLDYCTLFKPSPNWLGLFSTISSRKTSLVNSMKFESMLAPPR